MSALNDLFAACTALMKDPEKIRLEDTFKKGEHKKAFEVFAISDAFDYWKLLDYMEAQYALAKDVQGWKRGPNRKGSKVKEVRIANPRNKIIKFVQRSMTAEEALTMTVDSWLKSRFGKGKGFGWACENPELVLPQKG